MDQKKTLNTEEILVNKVLCKINEKMFAFDEGMTAAFRRSVKGLLGQFCLILGKVPTVWTTAVGNTAAKLGAKIFQGFIAQ